MLGKCSDPVLWICFINGGADKPEFFGILVKQLLTGMMLQVNFPRQGVVSGQSLDNYGELPGAQSYMYRICFIIFPRRLWKSEWSNTPALAEAWPLQLEFVYHQKQLVAVCLLFRMPIQITVGDQSPSPKQPKHARDPTHRHLWLSKFKMEMQLCCLCYHINATYHHGHTGPWRKFELTLDPDTYIPVRHGFRCSTPVVSCD